jgi:hypothetical protein
VKQKKDPMSEYINFPVALLQDLQPNIKKVIDNIFDYHLYNRCVLASEDIDNLDPDESHWGIKYGDLNQAYENGERLYEGINASAPQASIRRDMLFDFYQNEKTEFEVDCFLAFIAIKSILQKDPCKKITNSYLLSRMAGNAKTVHQLPERLIKYKNRYQIDKLKTELKLNWGLKHYGRYTRGSYMSFKMKFEDLVKHVEKRRKSYRVKQSQNKDKSIIQSVIASLNQFEESF